jgi:hypothetical protein
MTEDELLDRITVDPAIFGGKPIIRGMRIAVEPSPRNCGGDNEIVIGVAGHYSRHGIRQRDQDGTAFDAPNELLDVEFAALVDATHQSYPSTSESSASNSDETSKTWSAAIRSNNSPAGPEGEAAARARILVSRTARITLSNASRVLDGGLRQSLRRPRPRPPRP